MDLSRIDGRYIEILRMVIATPGIRQSAITGQHEGRQEWRKVRLDMLVEDGLVSVTETPHRGRYGYVREYAATPMGIAADALFKSLENLKP